MFLGIYGTGGTGREILEVILSFKELASRWEEIIFIDDTKETGFLDKNKMYPFEEFKNIYSADNTEIVIALGEPIFREMLADKVRDCGYKLATIISPNADVRKSAKIGAGVVVHSLSLVSTNATIDDNVYIQANAIVGHDVHINENCQISSYSIITGRTVVERNVYIGASASIREDLVIGHDSVISMGAVVLKSVNPERIVMGNPAREIAENKDRRVFKETPHN